jgi:transcriptional regulator of acetoin/glycerol metabolism
MHPSLDLRALQNLRQRFFSGEVLPSGTLRREIVQSWQRCRNHGLAADRPPAVELRSAAELRERCERSSLLRERARPELVSLHEQARETGSIVVLTDAEGLILEAIGSPDFLDRAARVALRPGAAWGESEAGTNAIGTALVEGRPVEVCGAEHWFAPHRILSCAAAPILDPFGRLAGVLDVSGDARLQHLHALGLVRMAVRQIEHRAFAEGLENATLLRLQRDPALLGTPAEAVLAFREGRLVAANPAGLKELGLDWSDLGRSRYDALFESAFASVRECGELLDRHGQRYWAKLQPPAGPSRPYAPARGATRPQSAPPAPPARMRSPSATELPPLLDDSTQRDITRAAAIVDAGLGLLIQGATGTGKEVFARAVHSRCHRRSGPFVAINCAALPESLIEAELFGYAEGAFTGARKQGNPGLLRQADGGVLFLDEIGDMPLALQARLLRVLQERCVQPLGGGVPVPVDFLLVCATHRDLEQAITVGGFRADLYYRINAYAVRLPTLCEHSQLRSLVERLWGQLPSPRPQLQNAALDALASCTWPGNYRQLVGCLRSLAVIAADKREVNLDDLPAWLRTAPASGAVTTPAAPGPTQPEMALQPTVACQDLRGHSRQWIEQVIDAHSGNLSRAAKALGVSRSTLYRKLAAP